MRVQIVVINRLIPVLALLVFPAKSAHRQSASQFFPIIRRRQGQRGGLGYANLSFSSALLHCGATAFLLMGTVLMLEAGQELNVGKAIAVSVV